MYSKGFEHQQLAAAARHLAGGAAGGKLADALEALGAAALRLLLLLLHLLGSHGSAVRRTFEAFDFEPRQLLRLSCRCFSCCCLCC
eukprot:12905507-Alexandrium_andersonii.AAC.1